MRRKDWNIYIGQIVNENILLKSFYYKKCKNRNRVIFKCVCLLCGNTFETSQDQLFRKDKKAVMSCGCILKQFCSELGKNYGPKNIKLAYTKHYKKWVSPTRKDNKPIPIYYTYRCMISRCYNKNDICYSSYGGKGISVCEEWLNYDNYYNWAMENGYKEKYEAHRLNNDLGYTPDNVVFLSDKDHNIITNYMKKTNIKSMTINDIQSILSKDHLG